MMRRRWLPTLHHSLPNMAATAIAALRRCCGKKAGGWMRSGLRGSGGVRGLRFHQNNQNVDVCGSTMGPAFGCGLNIRTMFGRMTLSRIVRMTEENTGCWTWSTSSHASAWRSGSTGNWNQLTWLIYSPTYSSCVESRRMSDLTTGQSSSHKLYAIGWPLLDLRLPISCLGALGRMGTVKASTRSCAMSCWMVRYSTHWRRQK